MNLLLNPSTFNSEALRFVMASVFTLELLMICIGMFFCMVAIVVLSRTSQLHINLTIILCVCAAQYLIGGSSRAFMIAELWSYAGGVQLECDNLMKIVYTVRVAMIFIACYSIPCAIAERVFATCMLKDYETRRRLWIPLFLYGVTSPVLMASVFYWFDGTMAEIIAIVAVLIANLIASLGLKYINRINLRRYAMSRLPLKVQKFYNNKRILSLSEEFQLHENLRSIKVITGWLLLKPPNILHGLSAHMGMIIQLIGGFRLCFGTLFIKQGFMCSAYIITIGGTIHVIAITSSNPLIANILLQAFDMFVATYAILVPVIGAHCNEIWMHEFCRLICCFPWRLRANKNVYPFPSRPSNDDPKAVAERYFQQLNVEWNQ